MAAFLVSSGQLRVTNTQGDRNSFIKQTKILHYLGLEVRVVTVTVTVWKCALIMNDPFVLTVAGGHVSHVSHAALSQTVTVSHHPDTPSNRV